MSGSGTGIVTPYNTHRGMDLDGAADYYARAAGLVGAADGTVGTLSAWFRGDGLVNGVRYTLFGSGGFFEIRRETTNVMRVLGLRPTAAITLDLSSGATTVTANGVWNHLAAAWNLATPICRMWLNGVDVGLTITANNNNIDYTRPAHAFGAGVGAVNYWPGAISEFYLNLAEYMDLAVEANRWLFRHPNGQPPNLGATGQLVTGTQPIVYFAEVAGAIVNLGSGGAFVAVGAPALSADSPKDRWVASLNHRRRQRRRHAA